MADILPVTDDDDAAAAFKAFYEKAQGDADIEFFNRVTNPQAANDAGAAQNPVAGGDQQALMDRMSPEPLPASGEAANAPADDVPAAEPDPFGRKLMGSVVKDILGGAVEATPQVVKGVLSALDEFSQTLSSLPGGDPFIGLQLVDPKTGKFDFNVLFGSDAAAGSQNGTFDFNVALPDASTVTGGFIKSTSQFLTGFLPALKGAKVLGAAKGAGSLFAGEMAAGAVADMVVFDPNEDRLSTYLNEVPALADIVPDWLADTNPENQTQWEGRLKNAIEGAGLGLAAESLMRAFKYYKAQRAVTGGPRPAAGAMDAAARDTLREASRRDIIQEVPDTAIADLGNPDAEELFVSASSGAQDETLATALQRISETKARVEQIGIAEDAVSKINTMVETLKAGGVEASPFDQALNLMRKGKNGSEAVQRSMVKRPALETIKRLGGIEPDSPLARELRSRDITPKNSPGLFKKGGVSALDNLPRSESDFMPQNMSTGPDVGNANMYLSEDEWIAALEAEKDGNPFRSQEQLQAIADADITSGMEEQLSRLNIDWRNMTNDQVLAEIKRIEDAAALEKRAMADAGTDQIGPDPVARLKALPDEIAAAEADLQAVTSGDMAARDAQTYENKALDFFGETKDIREAGYILHDGKMVDFSGKHEIDKTDLITLKEYTGTRNNDHSNIAQAVGHDVEKFQSLTGAIRFMPESGAFSAVVKPSDKQIKRILKGLRELGHNDGIFVDIPNATGTDFLKSEFIEKPNFENIKKFFADAPDFAIGDGVKSNRVAARDAAAARVRELSDEYDRLSQAFDRGDVNARSLDDLTAEDKAIWESMSADERAQKFPGIDPNSNAKQGKIFVNHARIREPADVKNLIQQLADADADAINAKRGGEKVTNAEMIKASSKEFTDLSDLLGRDPGPMTAPQAIAARRILNASGEQVLSLAERAASPTASTADLFAFRRAMVVHYSIQAEVIAARTETARALQSWSVFTGSSKGARNVVCVI